MMSKDKTDLERANEYIEQGIGMIYRGLFLLRKANEIREEFHKLETIMKMLAEDRIAMMKKYPELVDV